jgi:hypothetical protein
LCHTSVALTAQYLNVPLCKLSFSLYISYSMTQAHCPRKTNSSAIYRLIVRVQSSSRQSHPSVSLRLEICCTANPDSRRHVASITTTVKVWFLKIILLSFLSFVFSESWGVISEVSKRAAVNYLEKKVCCLTLHALQSFPWQFLIVF